MSTARRVIVALALVASLAASGSALADLLDFGAHLSAGEEAMPVGIINNSRAQGQALFELSDDGTQLHYKLIAANINNAFAALIHIGR